MVKDVQYSTITEVLDSWEALRRIPRYEVVAGSKIFEKFFDKCPDGKVVFGFAEDIDPHSDEILCSKKFIAHAAAWIRMLDSSVALLGPDIELLTEIMTDLGAKHRRYGVTSNMFRVMGTCLTETLNELLGDDKFTKKTREAWDETYFDLTADMLNGMEGIVQQ